MRPLTRLSVLLSCQFIQATSLFAQVQSPEWSERKDLADFMNSPACESFHDYTFSKWEREKKNQLVQTIQTEAVLIVRGGVIQYEKYLDIESGKVFSFEEKSKLADTPHILWSASKSITATIVARAVQEGKLKLDSKLAEFYPRDPSFQDQDLYNQITVQHLLDMSAGLKWNESYESDPKDSSVTKMLYKEGSADSLTFALNQPMSEKPGTKWNYSSGNSTILFGILRKIYGESNPKAYHDVPWALLFDELGMKNAVFEVDAAGHFIGSSYAHLRPRDMAKIGQLYLNDGKWGGKQLLPSQAISADGKSAAGKSWVGLTRDVAKPYVENAASIKDPTGEGVYGLTWWLNHKVQVPFTGKINEKPYPCVPEDFYGAFGHYGQYIFVVPSLDLVVVRTATDRDPHMFSVDKWMVAAMQCLGLDDKISKDSMCRNK